MGASAYIFVGLIGLIAVVGIIWRFASRRQSLPCPTWLGWMVELDNPFTKTNRASVIIEHLELATGMAVLDVGCGPGRLTIPAAKAVGTSGSVVAVDMQPGMLKRAQEKAQSENLGNIEFVEAATGEGKLGDNRFDRAILVTVLGEIPDQEAAMKEIYEALKPGGILSVTELIFDPHFQSRKTVTRLAEAAGFKEAAFYGNRIAFTLNLVKPSNEHQVM